MIIDTAKLLVCTSISIADFRKGLGLARLADGLPNKMGVLCLGDNIRTDIKLQYVQERQEPKSGSPTIVGSRNSLYPTRC